MTNEVKKVGKNESSLSKRLHRRSLLKAGAVVAPIALTLHGGVPLAHADSSGSCIFELYDIANDPNHPNHEDMLIPMNPKNGHFATVINGHVNDPGGGGTYPDNYPDNYPDGTYLEPFNPTNEEHWKFIAQSPANYGYSCIVSVTNVRLKGNNGFGNYDQSCPGGSCPNNDAENDFPLPGNNPHTGIPN